MATAFDPKTARPSVFAAHSGDAYEQVMGRWSRRLAPLLIAFGGLADGECVLDVGCGTGSLTFALAQAANLRAVEGIDQAQVYVDYLRAHNSDPRITVQQADARALPFSDATFDRAFSMLVLQFIPDAERAVAEMRRVVRPGGMVTAAMWDSYGGMPHLRMMWDIAAMLDPSAKRPRTLLHSMGGLDEMAAAWRKLGMQDVVQTSLTIRMDFADFDDYWQPYTTGEGGSGAFVASLSDEMRHALREQVRLSYCSNRPDGPRSFACTAWACRGVVTN